MLKRLAAVSLVLIGCTSESEPAPATPTSSGMMDAESGLNGSAPAASASDDAVAVADPAGTPSELMTGGPAPATFPPPWCDRTGSEGGGRWDVVIEIADSYWYELESDCRTAKLTASFSDYQGMLWLGYLAEYTYLMTGCPLDGAQPAVGGLAVFGLANTPIVGAERGPLGRDDVELLTEMYVARFGDALQLTPAEQELLRDYLLGTAEPEVDPLVSATLSTCEDAPSSAP